jgi:hypothetical protein
MLKPKLTTMSTATEAQVQRVLARLKRGPATTLNLRSDQDVIHPAGRIAELRRRGYRISTYMVDRQTDAGAWHRVGMYRLHAGKAATP